MSSDGTANKQSLHYIVRSGLAGGIAGCVAKTVVAPLDRVKILFQASNPEFRKYAGTWTGLYQAGAKIYREAGVRGLLQGHSATLLRIFPYAAIKYMAYDQVESILMPTKEYETNFRRFSAGAISGVISVFFTYPLELIRVRMAFSTPQTSSSISQRHSFLDAVSRIYQEGSTTAKPPLQASASSVAPTLPPSLFSKFPILKFYRGFTVTVIGMIPYAGTSFLSWGFLHERLDRTPKSKPKPALDLLIGAISGALAQTVSYPAEVVRRRMQVGGLTRPDRWLHWGETVKAIYATQGVRGFFVGLSIGYIKIAPMTAVSFTVWQWGKRWLGV